MWKHRHFFLYALLFFTSTAVAQSPRPNVILVLVDDMGWSDLGCFGSEIQTPHLDSLAQQGLRMTTVNNAAKCTPSRAMLLSGVHNQQCGFPGSSRNQSFTQSVTLAEVLREAGYRTLMAGKHHGEEPLVDRGFDHAFGLLDGAGNHFNPGLQRPSEGPPAQKRNRFWMHDQDVFMSHDPARQHHFPAGFYTTTAFTDTALAYLETYKADTQPFFLYLSYTAPHDPLHALPQDTGAYTHTYLVGYDSIRTARHNRQVATGLLPPSMYPLSNPVHQNWNSLSPNAKADQAKRMQLYAAMIHRLDLCMGQIVEKLDSIGKRNNTLICFLSDNGASHENVAIGAGQLGEVDRWASQQQHWANVSNTPFRRTKTYSYEGGISTSMVVNWPGGLINPNRISHAPIHFVDFMATLTELAGADYPRIYNGDHITPMEGSSFCPQLYDLGAPHRKPIYHHWDRGRSVRDSLWKLVEYNNGGWELYSMLNDRTETNDLAGSFPRVVAHMDSLYTAWHTRVNQDFPIVQDDSYYVPPLGSDTLAVLLNDYDSDGSLVPSSLVLLESPAEGTVQLDSLNGRFIYTHTGDSTVQDTFTYRLLDDDGATSYHAYVIISFTPPENICPVADFSQQAVLSYGGTQDGGQATVLDNGATLMIENNAWKAIFYPYLTSPLTRIDFDFRSTVQGEEHLIGMDEDLALNPFRRFKLYGTQNTSGGAYQDFNTYPGTGNWVHYSIPIGSYYTGAMDYIVFGADHDVGAGNGNSFFRNVVVYEDVDGDSTPDECTNLVGALPVVWRSIEAVAVGDVVELDWSVWQWGPRGDFVVERSGEGRDFVVVGEVEGEVAPPESHGISGSSQIRYAFQDTKAPRGRLYYRVRWKDVEGLEDISPTVEVNLEVEGLSFEVYPVPLERGQALSLVIDSDVRERASWELLNGLGESVQQGQLNLESGRQTLQLPFQEYSAGWYILRLKLAGTSAHRKVQIN